MTMQDEIGVDWLGNVKCNDLLTATMSDRRGDGARSMDVGSMNIRKKSVLPCNFEQNKIEELWLNHAD